MIIKFSYCLDNININIFTKEIDKIKYLEIFVKDNGYLKINSIKMCISGVSEYIYSNTSVERKNDFKEFKLDRVSNTSNIYFNVIQWNNFDAMFYFEYELLNNEKMKTEIFEINYLGFEISKKNWNDSIYFIMIDRFIENKEIDRWQNEDFYAGGAFRDILNDLKRISNDGYTTVYLSPIMSSMSYHGYNQMNLDSINSLFGGKEELVKLIDEMNKYNLKLGVEIVANHLSVFSKEFREGLKGNNDLFYIGEDCTYETYRNCVDLAKIKYSNESIKWIFEYVKKLIINFNIKFIRLDCCDYLDHTLVNILSQYCKEKGVVLIGECWSNYDNFFNHYAVDGATNYKLYGYMINMFINRTSNVKDFQEALISDIFKQGFQKNNSMLNFIDNHDVDRISNLVKDVKIIKLLLGFIFMYIGIPLVYYGTENFGDTVKNIVANRRCIFRDNFDDEIENHIKEMSAIRKKFINDNVYFESRDEMFIFSRDTYDGRISFIYNNSNEEMFIGSTKIEGYDYTII